MSNFHLYLQDSFTFKHYKQLSKYPIYLMKYY